MEAAEPDGTEVDVPEVVVDLFEADELSGEYVADVDPAGVPSDASVPADPSDLEVSGVLDGGQVFRERSWRGRVYGSGGELSQRFVRSLLIVLEPERVEPSLLSGEVAGRWSCGLRLEGSVHSFVSSVLLGVRGLDELGVDAELDPPDGEP